MNVKNVTSIGWLNCANGTINLTPVFNKNCYPKIVNVSKDEFNEVKNDVELMKELAIKKIQIQ